ncbi:MAG: bifunctional demethylmenaquinone methyltransferase/2-methoxy-6-polyprenyl-1,4-benzoquinol methylase UbiE [Acidobacteria bacterium]|nr:bifunctional demethylmenaquinone methyltransferase/2-methoxy-6-polyprenyl-1,4-benzoquinol methylase UbiE [Acidobacteriota bacterium]
MIRARGALPSAAWVRTMFTRVAPRYDLLNHLLSFNQDRRWRARTACRLSGSLAQPGARVLDLCCGTGDLLLALQAGRPLPVIGCDFSRAMLALARRKAPRCALVEADALRLPFADASLDLITIAFGFRNLTDYHTGLEEMRRVLKPGGTLAILEFSRPSHRWWAALFGFYSRFVLPLAGGIISGEPTAYRYLPASVRRFPSPDELATDLRQAGFDGVTCELMSGGIVTLHLGRAG